jgi:serine/threonine protein kinase
MYMPPELLAGNYVDPFKHDVFSAGVLFYQMLYGRFPWAA